MQGPSKRNVRPVRAVAVNGDVTGARSLIHPGGGRTQLTTVEGGPPATILLDYGREVGGNPYLDVVEASPANEVAQAFSESRAFLSTDPPISDFGGTDSQTDVGAGRLSAEPRGGFRFQVVQLSSPGTLTLSRAGVVFSAYRASPQNYRGYFLSSDDELNRIWYAGAYTTQLVMAGDAEAGGEDPRVLDGAKRDRAVWAGDLVAEDPPILLTLGTAGRRYVKNSLRLLLGSQSATGRIPSVFGFLVPGALDYAQTYSAYAAIAAIDYYRYTGDGQFIRRMLPRLRRATAFHATLLDDGLIVSDDPDYWQTIQNGRVTEYSLVYHQLLTSMAWAERQVGTGRAARSYRSQAANLATRINAGLFDPGAGAYIQSDLSPGVFPQDANANAVRLGVAKPNWVQGILTTLRRGWTPFGGRLSQPEPSLTDPGGHSIEPLSNGWESDARFDSGDAAGALRLMRRLWGHMIDRDGPSYTGTFWEFLNADGNVGQGSDSLAHGWSAAPTQQLTEHVLGVTPLGPGYRKWSIAPQPGSVAWARGRVPTPSGPIDVRWRRRGSASFTLQVDSPEGSRGELELPIPSRRGTLTIDGREVSAVGRVEGGTHTVRWRSRR